MGKLTSEKEKKSHNLTEKERKDKIRNAINKLGTLLPDAYLHVGERKRNMLQILEASLEYVALIKEKNEHFLEEKLDEAVAIEIRGLQNEIEKLKKCLNQTETLLNQTRMDVKKCTCVKQSKVGTATSSTIGFADSTNQNLFSKCKTKKSRKDNTVAAHIAESSKHTVSSNGHPGCADEFQPPTIIVMPSGYIVVPPPASSASTHHEPITPAPCSGKLDTQNKVQLTVDVGNGGRLDKGGVDSIVPQTFLNMNTLQPSFSAPQVQYQPSLLQNHQAPIVYNVITSPGLIAGNNSIASDLKNPKGEMKKTESAQADTLSNVSTKSAIQEKPISLRLLTPTSQQLNASIEGEQTTNATNNNVQNVIANGTNGTAKPPTLVQIQPPQQQIIIVNDNGNPVAQNQPTVLMSPSSQLMSPNASSLALNKTSLQGNQSVNYPAINLQVQPSHQGLLNQNNKVLPTVSFPQTLNKTIDNPSYIQNISGQITPNLMLPVVSHSVNQGLASNSNSVTPTSLGSGFLIVSNKGQCLPQALWLPNGQIIPVVTQATGTNHSTMTVSLPVTFATQSATATKTRLNVRQPAKATNIENLASSKTTVLSDTVVFNPATNQLASGVVAPTNVVNTVTTKVTSNIINSESLPLNSTHCQGGSPVKITQQRKIKPKPNILQTVAQKTVTASIPSKIVQTETEDILARATKSIFSTADMSPVHIQELSENRLELSLAAEVTCSSQPLSTSSTCVTSITAASPDSTQIDDTNRLGRTSPSLAASDKSKILESHVNLVKDEAKTLVDEFAVACSSNSQSKGSEKQSGKKSLKKKRKVEDVDISNCTNSKKQPKRSKPSTKNDAIISHHKGKEEHDSLRETIVSLEADTASKSEQSLLLGDTAPALVQTTVGATTQILTVSSEDRNAFSSSEQTTLSTEAVTSANLALAQMETSAVTVAQILSVPPVPTAKINISHCTSVDSVGDNSVPVTYEKQTDNCVFQPNYSIHSFMENEVEISESNSITTVTNESEQPVGTANLPLANVQAECTNSFLSFLNLSPPSTKSTTALNTLLPSMASINEMPTSSSNMAARNDEALLADQNLLSSAVSQPVSTTCVKTIPESYVNMSHNANANFHSQLQTGHDSHFNKEGLTCTTSLQGSKSNQYQKDKSRKILQSSFEVDSKINQSSNLLEQHKQVLHHSQKPEWKASQANNSEACIDKCGVPRSCSNDVSNRQYSEVTQNQPFTGHGISACTQASKINVPFNITSSDVSVVYTTAEQSRAFPYQNFYGVTPHPSLQNDYQQTPTSKFSDLSSVKGSRPITSSDSKLPLVFPQGDKLGVAQSLQTPGYPSQFMSVHHSTSSNKLPVSAHHSQPNHTVSAKNPYCPVTDLNKNFRSASSHLSTPITSAVEHINSTLSYHTNTPKSSGPVYSDAVALQWPCVTQELPSFNNSEIRHDPNLHHRRYSDSSNHHDSYINSVPGLQPSCSNATPNLMQSLNTYDSSVVLPLGQNKPSKKSSTSHSKIALPYSTENLLQTQSGKVSSKGATQQNKASNPIQRRTNNWPQVPPSTFAESTNPCISSASSFCFYQPFASTTLADLSAAAPNRPSFSGISTSVTPVQKQAGLMNHAVHAAMYKSPNKRVSLSQEVSSVEIADYHIADNSRRTAGAVSNYSMQPSFSQPQFVNNPLQSNHQFAYSYSQRDNFVFPGMPNSVAKPSDSLGCPPPVGLLEPNTSVSHERSKKSKNSQKHHKSHNHSRPLQKKSKSMAEVDTNLSNSIFEPSIGSMPPYFSIPTLSPPRNDVPGPYLHNKLVNAHSRAPSRNNHHGQLQGPLDNGPQVNPVFGMRGGSFNLNTIRAPRSVSQFTPRSSAIPTTMPAHLPNFNLSKIFPDISSSPANDSIGIPPIKFPQGNTLMGNQPVEHTIQHHPQNASLYNRSHPPPVIHNAISINSILGHSHNFERPHVALNSTPIPPPFHPHGHMLW